MGWRRRENGRTGRERRKRKQMDWIVGGKEETTERNNPKILRYPRRWKSPPSPSSQSDVTLTGNGGVRHDQAPSEGEGDEGGWDINGTIK